MKKLELFPTPVAIFDIQDAESINKELMKVPTGSFNTDMNLWNLVEEYGILKTVHDLFLEKAAEYLNSFYDQNYTSDMFYHKRGWKSVRKTMDYNTAGAGIHNHRMTTIAMTYYVDVSDNTSPIYLLDSRSQMNWASLDDSKTYHVHKHHPKTGELIMFPGWLFHDVPLNKGEQPRIAISSNIQLKDSCKINLN